MIIFIGGPPRVGKSELAKALSKKTTFPWISTDNLRETIAEIELIPRDHPLKVNWINWHESNYIKRMFSSSVANTIKLQIEESREVAKLVRSFVDSIVYNERDFIIEGVALMPDFYSKEFLKTHDVTFVCIGNTDFKSFLEFSWHHRTEGDWLKNADKKTYKKVIDYCSQFSKYYKQTALKHNIPFYEIKSATFTHDISKIVRNLTSSV